MTDITELAQKRNAAISRLNRVFEPGHSSQTELDALSFAVDVMNELVEALGKAQTDCNEYASSERAVAVKSVELQDEIYGLKARIAELEFRTVTDWIEHDGKWRPDSLITDELVYLKTRKQELKIPYPAGKVMGWMHTGSDMDVIAYKLASPQATIVTAAAADVLAERQRQVTAEGWTPEHDDEHSDGEMALAASSYALYAHKKPIAPAIPYNWPWEPEWFKQQGARRDLVKAAALILAEIERLDRATGIKVKVE
ncbi:hypothetical protein [Klebsiella grimontii]|uniref:hypothetical protein n=1 Tax=Klebsiella grimontii TaxID=2058152 RepID=UPI0012B91B43|nr:hypothetical protein [Klebsiella grimontii]MBZ7124661.1 hypothetical protein [Klebsiella grimontii]